MTEENKATPIREAIEATSPDLDRLLQKPTVGIGTADMILQPGAMDAIDRAATMMSKARHMMPPHLRDSPGDCMAVLMQAAQWGMNPFAVAQKTFMVGQLLGYEAQLIKAAVDTSPQLDGRLSFEWFGPWDNIMGKMEWRQSPKQGGGKYPVAAWTSEDEVEVGVICRGLLRGEAEPRELRIQMSQAHPRNSTLWVTDPKQQIAYLASKRWARLYLPEVLMGVYDYEEGREIEEKVIESEAEVIRTPRKKDEGRAETKQATEEQKCQDLVAAMRNAPDIKALNRLGNKAKKTLTPEYVEKAKQVYEEMKQAFETPPTAASEPAPEQGKDQDKAAPAAESKEEGGEAQTKGEDFFNQ